MDPVGSEGPFASPRTRRMPALPKAAMAMLAFAAGVSVANMSPIFFSVAPLPPMEPELRGQPDRDRHEWGSIGDGQNASAPIRNSAFDRMHQRLYGIASTPGGKNPRGEYKLGVSVRRGSGGLKDPERLLLAGIYSNVTSVFESGLGESTAIAAHVGVPRYTGVDTDAAWVAKSRDAAPPHFKFHFADIGKVRNFGNPIDESLRKIPYDAQTAPLDGEREAFDFYFIDGRYRVASACAAFLHAMARGGDMERVMVGMHDIVAERGYIAIERVGRLVHKAETLHVYKLRPDRDEGDILELWEKFMWDRE